MLKHPHTPRDSYFHSQKVARVSEDVEKWSLMLNQQDVKWYRWCGK